MLSLAPWFLWSTKQRRTRPKKNEHRKVIVKSKTLLAMSAIIGIGIAVAMILDKGDWSVRPDTKQEVATSAVAVPTLTSTGAQSQASGIPANETVQTDKL